MERTAYESAVARLRQLGLGPVVERDWPATPTSRPYRRAELRITTDHAGAPELARALTEAAVEIDGHLVLQVHPGSANLDLSVSRLLTEEEAAGLEPGRSREVGP
jgi:hypothetical protein